MNNTGRGEFRSLCQDTGTPPTTTDDTVARSTTYTYRIKAINEYGVSERSRWFHVDTPGARTRQAQGPRSHGDPRLMTLTGTTGGRLHHRPCGRDTGSRPGGPVPRIGPGDGHRRHYLYRRRRVGGDSLHLPPRPSTSTGWRALAGSTSTRRVHRGQTPHVTIRSRQRTEAALLRLHQPRVDWRVTGGELNTNSDRDRYLLRPPTRTWRGAPVPGYAGRSKCAYAMEIQSR